jgi:RNA recognition motif-containing protein
MNLYVGNLANELTDEDLRKIFSEYGKVSSAKVIRDRFSHLSKGFGFVEMPSNREADAAIKALNREDLKGSRIQISEARSKREKRRSHRGRR